MVIPGDKYESFSIEQVSFCCWGRSGNHSSIDVCVRQGRLLDCWRDCHRGTRSNQYRDFETNIGYENNSSGGCNEPKARSMANISPHWGGLVNSRCHLAFSDGRLWHEGLVTIEFSLPDLEALGIHPDRGMQTIALVITIRFALLLLYVARRLWEKV